MMELIQGQAMASRRRTQVLAGVSSVLITTSAYGFLVQTWLAR